MVCLDQPIIVSYVILSMPVDPIDLYNAYRSNKSIAHWWGKYAEKLQIISAFLSHGELLTDNLQSLSQIPKWLTVRMEAL